MPAVLERYDPLVSEFESAEHEAHYLARLRNKVAQSYADPRPRVPHDQALKRLRAVLDAPLLDISSNHAAS